MRSTISLMVLAACSGGSGKGGGSGSGYHPAIDPANFTAIVDNPFFPLTPGTTLHYSESVEEGTADTDYQVTADTKEVMGVECVVIHDTTRLHSDGTLLEDTYDWYAQDLDGNVWYFGEDTTAYDLQGNADTAGSWTGGVDGAEPGILMEADPQIGDSYRQEFLEGEAEDQAKITSVSESVEVAAGAYDGCIETDETTALEPGLVERKWYARGIGEIKAVDVKGGSDTSELASVTTE